MQKVYEFLKENHVFYFGTSHDGQPEVRPFGVVMIYDGKLYSQTGMKKRVFKEMEANPKVTICCFDGKGTWLRVNATAVIDKSDGPCAAVLEEMPSLKSRYAVGDGNHVTFYLKDATAYFSCFTAPDEVHTW